MIIFSYRLVITYVDVLGNRNNLLVILQRYSMEEFVNRKSETQKLDKMIKSDCKVSVIFSHEGIGKSCFIEHFISEFFEDKALIIKNSELDFADNVEKYYFADKICEAIFSKAEKNFAIRLINKMCNLKITPNVSFTYGWFSLNLEINEKFSLLLDLIIKLLKNKKDKFIIYIDNANKMDYQSIVFINQIIKQIANVFFILEFKLEKEERFPTSLIGCFKSNEINYNYIELEKLSSEHVCEVMKNNNIANIEEIINTYDTFDGNLKELILMNEKNVKKHFKLDKDEEFILEFIYLTKGELSYDEMYNIIHSYAGSNSYFLPLHTINEYIDELYTEGLVDFNSSKKLYLTFLGKNHVKMQNEYLITEMLTNYYIPIIIKDKSEFCLQGLKILLPLLSKNADARIKKILPSLHKNIVISRCYKKIIDDIYNNIDLNSDNDEIRIELIKLYISFGDYKTALNKIKFLINKPDDTTMVLYATLISHIYAVEIAEKNVIEFLSRVASREAKSAIFTCLIALYMKIKSSNEVLEYVDYLKNNNEITETDLNIINKNISIYYEYDVANTMLNDSLLYFKRHDMTKLSIATNITLATRFAQKGYIEDAHNKLIEILNIKYISEMDYIYVTNNIAVIKMLENDFESVRIKDLINYHKYIQDEYTKLLVTNNLLIYYCNMNNYEEAEQYAKELENVGFDKYKFESYLLLTYLNLRFFYQKVNANKIQFFNNKLQKLLDDCRDDNIREYIKSMIDGSELSADNGLHFLSQFNYRPAFLGHWIINNFDY